MPSLDQVSYDQLQVIWLVTQHARLGQQRRMYPYLEESMHNGGLRKQDLYMLKDRILLHDGKPQLYGTQICRDSLGNQILCDVADPEYLDQRRLEAGFIPINEYLASYGITLE